MSEMHNEQEAPIRAWLSYYINGSMTGAWQDFPTTNDAMEYNLGRSGIEAEHLTGILYTVYETDIPKLELRLPRHPDLDELNYLAARIDGMSELDQLTFSATVEANLHCGSMTELINLTHNLDAFDLYPGSFSDKEFGGIMQEMHGTEHWEVMENLRTSDDPNLKAFAAYVERLESSVDLPRYGKLAREAEDGYLTYAGYLLPPEDALHEVYSGKQDIPAEYRLTAPPVEQEQKPSLLGQLAAAKDQAADVASRLDAPEKKAPSGPEL